MKIVDIDPSSPLFGYVRPGYQVLLVNGASVQDVIDFRFKTSDERVNIVFADVAGEELEFQFDDLYTGDLGITLDDHKVKTCRNDCIFCFIRQQPQGMRRSLYIKDEDYRLSFTHGNFVTLSNTTDADIARIIEQRLSPIYVSVHATDDKLRRCMLKNEKLAPIIPRLRELAEGGITVHTQVVLCPGVNDGDQLENTISQLSSLAPAVESLAVVPVGLTKYREKLPNLRNYTSEESNEIIDYIHKRQKQLTNEIGTRFVWVADEFYVIADRQFPRRSDYEEMNQFENGIGMAREFITKFNRRKAHCRINSDKRVLFFTGRSAHPFLTDQILPYVRNKMALDLTVEPIKNRFWGEMVTVSGLLCGQDMLRRARELRESFDVLVLPPNCLNNDNLFLDNLSLDQFRRALDKPVLIGRYDLVDTLKEAFN